MSSIFLYVFVFVKTQSFRWYMVRNFDWGRNMIFCQFVIYNWFEYGMFENTNREGINVVHLYAFWKIIYRAPLPSFDNTELL